MENYFKSEEHFVNYAKKILKNKGVDATEQQLLAKKKEWRGCKYVKREGESCTLNNKCTYPNCEQE